MNRQTGKVVLALIAVGVSTFGRVSTTQASEGCKLVKVGELPITMESFRPKLPVKLDGKDASFVLDSGAFYSTISSATAAQYHLKLINAPYGYEIQGVGGSAAAQIAIVKELTIVGATIKNAEFLVAGGEVGGDGLMGQNLLQNFDVEYDLAHGAIRLFHTSGCGHSQLAYWLKPGEQYSFMPIDPIDRSNPHTIGYAYVNGKRIKVAFDTGAFMSVLSTSAAERAGVKTDSPGVSEAGYSGGIGRGLVKTYIARFDSFKIGDGEEIQHAKLRFAKMDLDFTDMLLGADFFISHRIFVSNKEHRIFLSYGGGPVFDLSKHTDQEAPAAASTAVSESEGDASDLARRGAALVARNDLAPGIALLSKAIALNPGDAEYYFRRANGYWADRQPDKALADFDRVVELQEDYLPAYIPRAELLLWKQDKPAAIADLAALDKLAPRPADLRFRLAEMYERLNLLPAAVIQLGMWIDFHPDDSRMIAALALRCRDRAFQDVELPNALTDCNAAIRRADKKNPDNSALFVDRALVRLRTGELDKAIGDCDTALKMMPKNADAFYVRGVLESRKNKKIESDADLDAAKSIAPNVTGAFERFGIAP